jgi:hypothetical protein
MKPQEAIKVKTICLPAALLFLAVRVQAQFIYEPFNYPITGETGINGYGGWVDNGNTHLVPGNLNMPAGMPGPVGNRAQATGGANASLGFPGAVTSGSVYFSYAFRLDSTGPYPSIIKAKDTVCLGDANGTLIANVRVIPTSTNTYEFALAKRGINMGTNSGSFNVGDTLFILGSYTFNPGTDDDTCNLWVNPDPATLGTAEPPTPGIQDVGAGRFDATDISKIILLCNAQLGPYTVDELRIGTRWQDVTPVPEPSTAGQLLLAGAAALLMRARRPRPLSHSTLKR